jgi:hypothetical protein
MRFSRRRQRERAEQANAEADAEATVWWGIARGLLPGVQRSRLPWDKDEGIEPYRGFRAGRGRVRPSSTGYDEPISPDRERWEEPRADDPTLDPILGDSDDEPWTPEQPGFR